MGSRLARVVRRVVLVAFALSIARDVSADDERDGERRVAFGMRAGLLPPVLVVAELIVRPISHVGFGVFGVAVPDRSSIGGEVVFETATPGRSTPYLRGALLRYDDSGASREQSTVAYATGGYVWKLDVGAEVELGAGALFLISDETGPCGTWCIRISPPPVLPTIDVALRAAFF